MLVACWSVKGGSGTTVVSAALSLMLARRSPGGALLADLAGDAPAVLGIPEPEEPGVVDWLAAGRDLGAEALERLEFDVVPGLRLLPRGAGEMPATDDDGERLTAALGSIRGVPPSTPRMVVVDCGQLAGGPPASLAAGAALSLLVLRPCYLALRRAVASALRPSGVILVSERDRALTAGDVEDVLGVPVRAVVPCDPAVARAVDAGLLASRVPRGLERALRAAA